MNLNELVISNYNYKTIDLKENDNCEKINANIFRSNDKCEECEINLKNKFDKSLNNDKNRSRFFYKRILINSSKEQNISENFDKRIYKSPFATCTKKRDKLKKINIMHYKTIKERQNLNNVKNLYDKYTIDVNDNNFNQIMFEILEDKSSKTIKNYRINDDIIFRTETDKYSCRTYKGKNINYINFKSYNKDRKSSTFIIKNNINYNKINSFLIIDNNKRNGSISPYVNINKAKTFKRQKNNNIYEINSYTNIHQYY